MPASLDLVSTVIGFGLIVVAGARLGAGSHLALSGLFPAHGRSDWPHGVQEADAPHFAVDRIADRASASPPPLEGPTILAIAAGEPGMPMTEPLEPQIRRFAPSR